MKLLVCDIETASLDKMNGEIIEVGFILTSWEGTKYKVISEFHSLIRPTKIERVNPNSLKVNHLKLEDLLKAPMPNEVRADLTEWWSEVCGGQKMTLLGHNYGMFDSHFMQRFIPSHIDIMFDYHAVDTWTMAYALIQVGILPPMEKLSLSSLTEVLDISHIPHRSLGDCYATLNLYKHLLEMLV
jgi:DNA polymerase III epsilon subunit-like protein